MKPVLARRHMLKVLTLAGLGATISRRLSAAEAGPKDNAVATPTLAKRVTEGRGLHRAHG